MGAVTKLSEHFVTAPLL